MIETGCPVRILQGVQDPDVPWNHAVELTSRLAQDDVVLTLVKDGDHRLSRPEDLERLIKAVASFSGPHPRSAAARLEGWRTPSWAMVRDALRALNEAALSSARRSS